MKKFFSFFLLSMGTIFPFEGDGDFDIMGKCITDDPVKLKYNSIQTKITFYGDSRMDFVNNGGVYGNNRMDTILNVPYGDNPPYSADQTFAFEEIQNFGVSGFRSYNVLGHLENCIPKLSENYKIGKRFVFHVGGNNFLDSVTASAHALANLPKTAYGRSILPAVLIIYFETARFNLRTDLNKIALNLKAISSQTNGRPDLLILGGYPALGWFTSTSGLGKMEGLDPLQYFLNVGFYLSAGLQSMEADYSDIAFRNNAHYLKVWDEMNNSVEYIAWDLIHPNDKGFKKWGSVVGKKLREISFNSAPKSRSFTSTGDRWKDAEMEYILARADLQAF